MQSQTPWHLHQNLLSLLLNPRRIGDWTILEYNLMENQCFSNPKEQQCQSHTESDCDAGIRRKITLKCIRVIECKEMAYNY
jgi:hypothetical protein